MIAVSIIPISPIICLNTSWCTSYKFISSHGAFLPVRSCIADDTFLVLNLFFELLRTISMRASDLILVSWS